MWLRNWGSTPEEIEGAVVGDHLLPEARLVATRSITLAAPPAEVFPWLRQMGFGRAGWYSYDLVDNLGRRSARGIHPEWQDLESGDSVPAGPMSFEAVLVEPPYAFAIRLPERSGRARVRFVLAYELRDADGSTRLVSRVRARVDLPFGRIIERFILGPGDGLMLRRQLLGLARRIG